MIVDLHINKKVFNEVYVPHLGNDKPLQIFYGGSSSGKSVFLAQRCILDVAKGGRNYLCVRNVKNTVKNSMFNEICKQMTRFKITKFFKVNHSELTITCGNGYQILFGGLDDVEKIKSITPQKGVITDIWIEEATEVTQNDVRQLRRRLRGKSNYPKRLAMSFNPILQSHWIFAEHFNSWDDSNTYYEDERQTILKTIYKDNLRFLEKEDIDLLENETDKYYKDVYTYGNWGVLGNLIFKNWEVRDLKNELIDLGDGKDTRLIETFDNYKNGLDFGFSSDPNAVVRTHYNKKRGIIYITDELYQREMTNDMLAEELKKLINREYITCDSAEPKSIRELQRLGVNALPAKKGKDSINFGIDWLQRQKIVIDIRCQNTKNEFQQYKWKEDKDGMALKVPVDKNNHIIDALRYCYESEMSGRQMTAARGFM